MSDAGQVADLSFTKGDTSATVSPDGKQVAFIVRGEVFVTSADYTTTKQITHTPAREAGVTFAPDNRAHWHTPARETVIGNCIWLK